MIRDVYLGYWIRNFHPGSGGSKRRWIPDQDPQHCFKVLNFLYTFC
jgi:hypothetical protein